MASKSTDFHLDKLQDLISLPKGKASMYAEACVWCMDQNGHDNGVDMHVLFEKKKGKHQIQWTNSSIDLQRIRKYYNIDDAVSFAAEAIAFFICYTYTNYNQFNRSIKTTGVDYWIGDKNINPDLPFQNLGRLEISGILTESETNTIDKRIKEKLKQTKQSDKTTLPVYVVVVAFGQPYAKMVVKNVNS